MAGQEDEREAATGGGQAAGEGTAGALQEGEPEAEQESAAAMDADVPQPPGTSETTEGQPS
jgi:hypothetical protein